MTIDRVACDLLDRIGGAGRMFSLAYDTAWVARLVEIDPALANRALDWVCTHQLGDGSWGTEKPFYYHDRALSTLAAMIALGRGRRACDRRQIEHGRAALERITAGATGGLLNDQNGPTVGFEMLAPPLAAEAESLGLIANQGAHILGRMAVARRKKLALLDGRRISRHLTAAFSAELAGLDGIHRLDLDNLKESDGSVGHSPSASAYYLARIAPRDAECLGYLRGVINDDGGAPDLAPFEIFETAWVLWNLAHAQGWPPEVQTRLAAHRQFLESRWRPGRGVGLSASYAIPDGDDTAIVFELLARAGGAVDLEALLSFEENNHFRTYHLEVGTSNSVNIHALGALRQAGRTAEDRSVQKILVYLHRRRLDGGFWADKWHLSPYYTTGHAIIACAGLDDSLAAPAVAWILSQQGSDGSWGRQFPTAEETAYCIQALRVWTRGRRSSPRIEKAIWQAAAWLDGNHSPPYPALWIGKGLYCPELVVMSTIVAALKMAREN